MKKGKPKPQRTKLKQVVLDAIQAVQEPITLSELSDQVERPPSHLYRVVETLERDGLVEKYKDEDKVFRVRFLGGAAPAPSRRRKRAPTAGGTVESHIAALRRLGVTGFRTLPDGEVEITRQQVERLRVG